MKGINLINDRAKARIENLPFIMSNVVYFLLGIIDNIVNGECDESVVASTICTLNNNTNGRYCREDLVSFEKVADILCYGKNRVALKSLLDKNRIKQVVINNHKVGYIRSEIMALRDNMNKEVRDREVLCQIKSDKHRRKRR